MTFIQGKEAMVTCPHCQCRFQIQDIAVKAEAKEPAGDQNAPDATTPIEPQPLVKPVAPRPSDFLTTGQAGAELGVHANAIMALIRGGHSSIFLPPDVHLDSRLKGPKGLRIRRSIWETFLSSRTFWYSVNGTMGPEQSAAYRQIFKIGPEDADLIWGPQTRSASERWAARSKAAEQLQAQHKPVAPRPGDHLTIAECARELAVDAKTILAHCRAGHVEVFLPNGVTLDDGRRGPKGLRIQRAEWERFLASRRFVSTPAPPDPKTPAGRRKLAEAEAMKRNKFAEAEALKRLQELGRRPKR